MKKIYWLLPLAIFGAQLVFSLNSNHQIRNEEAVASIREVWWFHEGLLYQPPNSNVGWYGALNFIYSIFGFDLISGKIYRLVLQLIGLYCLAYLLKKYLGEKLAWLPILTIGLSPTMLFWNTVNNPYGIDLQYLLIVAALIDQANLLRVLGWFLAMVGWLSFPTFVFYLPALVIWEARSLHPRGVKVHPGGVLIRLAAFLTPLILVMIYYKGWPGKLFFSGGTFEPDQVDFIAGVAAVFTNFFNKASAYYLEISQVEFSLIFPSITFLYVIACGILIFKKFKNARLFIALCAFVALFNLIITAMTVDGGGPGGRRSTPVLASFYGIFVLSFYYIYTQKIKFLVGKFLGVGILSLLLIHHLIAFPLNLESVKTPSFFRLNIWFGEGDPTSGLGEIMSQLQQKDLYLNCDEAYPGDPQCQYGIIYAAVAQGCLHNSLNCHQMYGYFPGAGYQPLSIESINYWQDAGFEH